jgi:hypothetical protein
MIALSALLRRFGRRPGSRHWVGPRPTTTPVALRISEKVGYPTSGTFDPSSLIEIDRKKAAELLALFSRVSLAYGPFPYSVREGLREMSSEALKDLKAGSRFYTNGVGLGGAASRAWSPLSNATFEGGVIGFDSENAFIYWIEEED